jgi:hypothetical protein
MSTSTDEDQQMSKKLTWKQLAEYINKMPANEQNARINVWDANNDVMYDIDFVARRGDEADDDIRPDIKKGKSYLTSL